MPEYLVRRISTNHAKVDMELAQDILYSNGLFLMSANTVLNDNHILKLKLYQIKFIHIKYYLEKPSYINHDNLTTTIPENTSSQITQLSTKSITNTENYIRFSQKYHQQETFVKDKLSKIGDGDAIKITELFSISNNLVQDLGSQRNLFNYLSHLKASDNVTYTHSINVSMLSSIFGKWLKLSNTEIELLTVAGLIHDIGKLKIPDDILNKPGELSVLEFEAIKEHASIGYDMIKDQDIDVGIKQSVLLHHEKMNGSGYPFALRWDKIHPFAKIVSIVDIYDAMTSERSYHHRYSPFKVIQMFEEECYGILDTKFMYIFLEHIAHNYIGSSARLSTGEECKIVFIHSRAPSRPIVQIDNIMIDLQSEPTLFIDSLL